MFIIVIQSTCIYKYYYTNNNFMSSEAISQNSKFENKTNIHTCIQQYIMTDNEYSSMLQADMYKDVLSNPITIGYSEAKDNSI